MRVIARGTLNDFVRNRVPIAREKQVEGHLRAWFAEVTHGTWANSAELKAQFRSASVVSAERVVFNIKGNDYRLIVAINYAVGVVLIKWLGTHREYDKIDAAEVDFEKARYTDSAHTQ